MLRRIKSGMLSLIGLPLAPIQVMKSHNPSGSFQRSPGRLFDNLPGPLYPCATHQCYINKPAGNQLHTSFVESLAGLCMAVNR